MQNKKGNIRIIFIGDVVGKYGRRMLRKSLEKIKYKYKPDLTIANGENSAGGLGIVKKTAEQLFEMGIDLISTGNHIWDKRKDAADLLESEPRVIRPLNFPKGAAGKGYVKLLLGEKIEFVLINLQGRVFMDPVTDNPFNAVENFLDKNGSRQENRIILVDFHAEATAEKQAMGYFLDGRVSAVLCTHTHIQTSDLRILSEGTAYQTDVGMTGTQDSIIGMDKYPIIQKFKDGMNRRFEVVNGEQILEMTILDFDPKTGQTVDCDYVRLLESKL